MSAISLLVPVREYLALVDQLVEAQDEMQAELLHAIGEGVPAQYRDLVLREVGPHIEVLWPISLRCLRDRTELTAADLQRVVATSRDRSHLGFPLSVSLMAIRAAIGRLGVIVVRRAGTRHPMAVVSLLSHAAVLSHQFSQAASAGREQVPNPRPAWAEGLPLLDRQMLRLAADGLSTRQIAERLHYSEQAVSYHLGQLMKLMAVTNRTALVARALQYELVSLSPAS